MNDAKVFLDIYLLQGVAYGNTEFTVTTQCCIEVRTFYSFVKTRNFT